MRVRRFGVALGAALLLAACSPSGVPSEDAGHGTDQAPADEATGPSPHDTGDAPPSAPLRTGERLVDLAMPAAYEPSSPTGRGTDDYRCFLLDPGLTSPAFITGVDVLPGRRDLVHHVILFRVPADQVAGAGRQDASTPGEGWTCFGGTGIGGDAGPATALTSAPWLGAWAPGGGESLLDDGLGIPLEAGSRVVMQVHYNLLAGDGQDVSSARLRLTDGTADLVPLETMLLPGPVELPCRPEHADDPLCDREAALRRRGRPGSAPPPASRPTGLQLLCGDGDLAPTPGDRADVRPHGQGDDDGPGRRRAHAPARQCHLDRGQPRHRPGEDAARHARCGTSTTSGRSVSTSRMVLQPGDVLRVTCHHDQANRDLLPAFDGQPESVRGVGRRHHGRDVPGHRDGHAAVGRPDR